jgi:hypothetical protein
VQPSGLFWTVPLPEGSVTLANHGRQLTVDVRDLAVLDATATASLPATVSFQMTWTASGKARRRGRPRANPTSAAAFAGRFLARAMATGTFAGTVGDFTFQSDATPVVRSRFAELGTERNGAFLRPSGRCRACGAVALP